MPDSVECMPNVFDFKDYREFLLALVKMRENGGFTQAELARAMNCQAAYLSQVLKGKAELTEDHGIKLCLFLNFEDAEVEYFLLILRLGRAGTPSLRSYLERVRQKMIVMHQEVESRISSQKEDAVNEANVYYCSSWIPPVLHTGVCCESYQSATALADRFELSRSEVELHLQLLEKYGFIRSENGKWHFQGGSIHFSKNSNLDQIFQVSRRMHALRALSQRKKNDVHYSTVLTLDEKTKEKVRSLLIATLEKAHKLSEPSPSEEVYSMCLDFFRA